MATLIKTDGTRLEVFPNDKKRGFTCEEMYNLIGCDIIECVGPNRRGESLIVDEIGKLKDDIEPNLAATRWVRENFGPYDVIVGNAVLVSKKEFK